MYAIAYGGVGCTPCGKGIELMDTEPKPSNDGLCEFAFIIAWVVFTALVIYDAYMGPIG
jgi:hypothetical protein